MCTCDVASNLTTDFAIDYLAVDVYYRRTWTWDGGGSTNNASEAANWANDQVVASGSDVVIPAGTKAMTWDNSASNPAVRNFTINSGYTNTVTLGKTLVVQAGLTINGGTLDMTTKALTVYDDLSVGSGATLTSTWIGGGALTMSVSGTASVTLGGAGTTTLPNLTIDAGKTVTLAGNVGVQLLLARNGALDLAGFTLTDWDSAMTGSGTFTASSGTYSTCIWNPASYTLQALTYHHLILGNCFTAGLDRDFVVPTGTTINGDLTVKGVEATLNVSQTVVGDVTVGNVFGTTSQLTLGATTLTAKGNLTINTGVTVSQSGGGVTFTPTGTKTWTDNTASKQDLGTVSISGGASTPQIDLGSSVKATSVTIAASHTLSDNGANTLTATNVTVNGTLSMTNSGSKLKISGNGTLAMNAGGTITMSDVATPIELTTADAVTPTYVAVSLTGGTLNVAELKVDYLNSAGFVIGSGVTLTKFDNVTWGDGASPNVWHGQAGASEKLFDIDGKTLSLLNHKFPDTWSSYAAGECNAQSKNSGVVSMWDWTGGFGGENNDCDTSGGEVVWKGGPGGANNSGAVGAPLIY